MNPGRGLGFPVLLLSCFFILSGGAFSKIGDPGSTSTIASGTVYDEVLSDQPNGKSASSGGAESQTASNAFKDGKYTAESPGWTGMTVEVTVCKGKIRSIQVLKAKGTPYFYKQVLEVLPKKIVDSGTPEIDGITGATLSSASLKDAVRSALGKAK